MSIGLIDKILKEADGEDDFFKPRRVDDRTRLQAKESLDNLKKIVNSYPDITNLSTIYTTLQKEYDSEVYTNIVSSENSTHSWSILSRVDYNLKELEKLKGTEFNNLYEIYLTGFKTLFNVINMQIIFTKAYSLSSVKHLILWVVSLRKTISTLSTKAVTTKELSLIKNYQTEYKILLQSSSLQELRAKSTSLTTKVNNSIINKRPTGIERALMNKYSIDSEYVSKTFLLTLLSKILKANFKKGVTFTKAQVIMIPDYTSFKALYCKAMGLRAFNKLSAYIKKLPDFEFIRNETYKRIA